MIPLYLRDCNYKAIPLAGDFDAPSYLQDWSHPWKHFPVEFWWPTHSEEGYCRDQSTSCCSVLCAPSPSPSRLLQFSGAKCWSKGEFPSKIGCLCVVVDEPCAKCFVHIPGYIRVLQVGVCKLCATGLVLCCHSSSVNHHFPNTKGTSGGSANYEQYLWVQEGTRMTSQKF